MSQPNYFFKSIGYILGRFLLARKYMIAHSPKYDLKLKFRTQDGGGRAIYKQGLYEERLTNFLIQKLHFNEGDLIFDVGANIGWYSNLFAKHKPAARVYCFEPDPENFEVLLSNLERNDSKTVTANKLGIGEQSETKKLYLYKKSNVGRHSMLDINEGPYIEVKVVSLDEFIRSQQLDFTKVKFLKIDIEGFEYFAFKGATEFLSHVPFILAEFSPGYMRNGGVEPAELLSLLHGFGFDPFFIEGLELIPKTDEELLERDKNINLIWLKKDHPLRP